MATKKPVTNFRGLYAARPERMTVEQLRAYLYHEFGEKAPHEANKKELLRLVLEQEEIAFGDFRDGLIKEESQPKEAA